MDDIQPDIRIANEARFFRIAVADDGETLPSQVHPSHPYGDVYLDAYGPSSRSKGLPPLRHSEGFSDGSAEQDDVLAARLAARAQQTVAPNVPRWPFTRYGPGPGGPASLIRNELEQPWRPYRSVWAETDLDGLLNAAKKQSAATPLASSADILEAQRRRGESKGGAGQVKWGAAVKSEKLLGRSDAV